jgi:lipid-A-disaccharide synthase
MGAPGNCIALVAGEASGDALGAELISALKALRPGLSFVGIGGPRMESAGCEIWWPAEKLAVRGYVEVLRHLPELLSIRRRLARRLLALRPAVFVGIDAPDFNLGLETKLKAQGIRTVHYVSPSLWAWRANRVDAIRRAVDHMLTLFPFETAIYERAGVPVSYVGHPLAASIPLHPDRAEMRERFRLRSDQPVFALLPGSRQSELAAHTRVFLATARLVLERYPDAQFLVPLASRETREVFERALYRQAEPLPLTVLYGHADAALTAADVALVASGTATLEAALYKCPHVITYRLSALTAALVRRKLRLPYVGLPNVLSERFIVPELLQDAATPENLAQALVNLCADKALRTRVVAAFERLHESLGADTTQLAARAVLAQLAAGAEGVQEPAYAAGGR